MSNPLLSGELLPRFDAIRPEHVEPAIRSLLDSSRARVAEIAADATPSFARVVEPLEELLHRLARTWSPVSHLNAVVNSAPLRDAYNACLPLLTEYQTDLAQSEPLYRAYAAVAEREAATLDPVQQRVIEHMLRDFRLAGVALEPQQKERFKAVMLELTTLQSKFEENVLDATNAWTRHVSDAAELAGLNETIVEQARARAHDNRQEGWVLALDQPT